MTAHQQSFDELARDTAPARHSDPKTSHKAAASPFRRNTQRHLLLIEYQLAASPDRVSLEQPIGLTDEEAASLAGILRGCPWKRCSELREMHLIRPTGETRQSSMGVAQNVCVITAKGTAVLDQLAKAK